MSFVFFSRETQSERKKIVKYGFRIVLKTRTFQANIDATEFHFHRNKQNLRDQPKKMRTEQIEGEGSRERENDTLWLTAKKSEKRIGS